MGAQFLIRPAEEVDIPRLSQIHGCCFRRGWSEDEFMGFLGRPQTYSILVSEAQTGEQSVLAAFILISKVENDSEILTLCVDPASRRQGLGRSLLLKICDELRGNETGNLFLEVSQKNNAAIGLYKSIGFKVFSTRRDYAQENDGSFSDAYLMKYSLV